MFETYDIKIKHPEQAEMRIVCFTVCRIYDDKVYGRLKSDVRKVFQLSNDYDFYFTLTDKDGDVIAVTESAQLLSYLLGTIATDKIKMTITPAQKSQQSTEQSNNAKEASQTDFSDSILTMMKHLELGMDRLQATVEKNTTYTVDNVVKAAAQTAAQVYRSLLPQPSLSEKPQFDVICDGCYSPIRGQRYHCETCDDFDLCSICKCRVNHDPAHNFRLKDNYGNGADHLVKEREQAITESACNTESFPQSPQTVFVCDYCDSDIVGIRHTCGACPDFDLCHSCFLIVKENHPQDHIFVTRLVGTQAPADKSKPRLSAKNKQTRANSTSSASAVSPSADKSIPTFAVPHVGVECDHCDASISGVRYKCGHCTNYDLCEACEQQSLSIHDETHAFIKIRYPIQSIIHRPLLPAFKQLNTVNQMTPVVHKKSNNQSQFISKPEEIITVSSNTTSTSTSTAVPPPPPATTSNTSNPSSSQLPSITKPNPTAVVNASFVSDLNIPDGTVIMWKLKNTGNVDWPLGSHLLFNGGSILRPYPISRPDCFAVPVISPGEETCLTAELQAPDSPGEYTSFFCLCTPDGERFGDNIWCTIKVDQDLEPEKDQQKSMSPAATIMMNSSTEMIFPTISTSSSVRSSQQEHHQQQPQSEGESQDEFAHINYSEDIYSEATTTDNGSTMASITTRTYTDSQVSSPSPSELDIGERAENIYYNYDSDEQHSNKEEEEKEKERNDERINHAYHVISPTLTATPVNTEDSSRADNIHHDGEVESLPKLTENLEEDDGFIIVEDEEEHSEEQQFVEQSEMSSSAHSTNTAIPQQQQYQHYQPPSLHDSFIYRSQILQLHEMVSGGSFAHGVVLNFTANFLYKNSQGFTGYDDLATSLLKMHDGHLEKVVSKLLEYP
ncbi:hypothetical protein [Parasitella parasitica]|uniref:ZZ-type domain-containing protein n=1 Tax=Parasitella parasitica TaxID=35722 RepID=A0A0B7N9J3_9FUNG|nr:hypothetical protein [Parasitella parasitica]